MALNELYPVLKPTGLLFVHVKAGVGEGLVTDERYGSSEKYYSSFSKGELSGLLMTARFVPTEMVVVDAPGGYRDTVSYMA